MPQVHRTGPLRSPRRKAGSHLGGRHATPARDVGYVAAAALVTAVWAGAIWASQHVQTSAVVHHGALFVHLASLVAGFGAVMTLDWFGARWLLGQIDLDDVLRVITGAHSLIWLGLAGLTLSGAFLDPDIGATGTRVKLAAVLVVGLNGLHANALRHALDDADFVGPALLRRVAVTAVVSQAGWWTAALIGHGNAA